jgi:DNA-binding GntR family transcriptional regulator
VNRQPLADQAYAELRSAIAGGALARGTPLVESAVAAMLGVSRTPVREALRRCELEGYLKRDSTGRLCVYRPSLHEMRDVFLGRELLETYAVRLAAERISDAELDRLDDLVAADRHALSSNAMDDLATLNEQIHGLIVIASRNRTLEVLMHGLPGRAYGLRAFAVGTEDDRARFVDDHGRLAALLRDGDERGAEALIRSHLAAARALLAAGLDGPDPSGREPAWRT